MDSSPRAHTGTLWLVSTPIGNLGDLSLRAARTAGRGRPAGRRGHAPHSAAAQPPAESGVRLARSSRSNEQNERARAPELVARLVAGESVALVSDAGTPLSERSRRGSGRGGRARRCCSLGRARLLRGDRGLTIRRRCRPIDSASRVSCPLSRPRAGAGSRSCGMSRARSFLRGAASHRRNAYRHGRVGRADARLCRDRARAHQEVRNRLPRHARRLPDARPGRAPGARRDRHRDRGRDQYRDIHGRDAAADRLPGSCSRNCPRHRPRSWRRRSADGAAGELFERAVAPAGARQSPLTIPLRCRSQTLPFRTGYWPGAGRHRPRTGRIAQTNGETHA